MAYEIIFSIEFEKSMKKLKKKDKKLFERIRKKTVEIVKNPERFKRLKNVLAGYHRIHFGSFVLVFKIEDDVVCMISLEHRYKAY